DVGGGQRTSVRLAGPAADGPLGDCGAVGAGVRVPGHLGAAGPAIRGPVARRHAAGQGLGYRVLEHAWPGRAVPGGPGTSNAPVAPGCICLLARNWRRQPAPVCWGGAPPGGHGLAADPAVAG